MTQATALRSIRRQRFAEVDLYPVTGACFSRGRSTLSIVDAVVQAGCRIVQLREKALDRRAYFELACAVRKRAPGVLLMCNDHLDVALAAGADGVHLGQRDLPVAAARAIAPSLLIGASAHSAAEALQAERDGADYVNLGPIFATATKPDARSFLGPHAIATIAKVLAGPFTVMGGITEANIDEVLAQGARHVAVVSAVTAADDPTRAASQLRARMRAWLR